MVGWGYAFQPAQLLLCVRAQGQYWFTGFHVAREIDAGEKSDYGILAGSCLLHISGTTPKTLYGLRKNKV